MDATVIKQKRDSWGDVKPGCSTVFVNLVKLKLTGSDQKLRDTNHIRVAIRNMYN